MTAPSADEARIRDWITGYRILMRGGLGDLVHAAGAVKDRDEQPYITVDDIEGLVDSRERAVTLESQTARVEALHKAVAWDRIPASACDDPKGHADRWFDDPWDSFCTACAETARYCAECTRVAINVDGDAECINWPCPTVAALTGSTE